MPEPVDLMCGTVGLMCGTEIPHGGWLLSSSRQEVTCEGWEQKDGNTALMECAWKGLDSMVDVLLKAKADPNVKSEVTYPIPYIPSRPAGSHWRNGSGVKMLVS